MKREQQVNPRDFTITVFGAGISGLTAAHELVERGFPVRVIDKDINEEVHDNTWDRGIGGMARSQYACSLTDPSNDRENVTRLEPSTTFLHDDVLVFDAGPVAMLTSDRAKEIVRRLAELLKSRPDLILDVETPCGSELSGDARYNCLVKTLASVHGMPDPNPQLIRQDPVDGAFAKQAAGRWLVFGLNVVAFPSEHGFRFFPAFYHHLFDTMKRTRIREKQAFERGLTVFDNLIPSEGLGLARAKKQRAFVVPRRPVTSFEELRNMLGLVLTELDYEVADLALFQLKLFKYMTSSAARRKAEYENMSWAEFVEIERYGRIARRHIDSSAQMTAALRGRDTDAHTAGNITVQLLLDQFQRVSSTDFKLNGPTSGAWFNHWHDYLVSQGVTFHRGTLEDFAARDGRIEPLVSRGPEEKRPNRAGSYYVLALSLPAMVELAPKFLKAAKKAGIELGPNNDFERVLAFASPKPGTPHGDVARLLGEDLKKAVPDGALQHLSGIQYYFDSDISFWAGHTQYLDSQWGLTSIAQPQFWARARDSQDAFRGLLSVDIGTWNVPFGEGTRSVQAWNAEVDTIATLSWRQIADHHDDAVRFKYGPEASLRSPIAYALDQNLMLDFSDCVVGDKTPFLVNRTGAFIGRPGQLIDNTRNRPDRWPSSKVKSLYQVHAKTSSQGCNGALASGYVMAGTFLKTYTRLTSMEAANESARHAVNALLNVLAVNAERCEIWDPEDRELPDLQWFKDLDQRLFEEGRPHLVDILNWHELPTTFSPSALLSLASRSTRHAQ